MDRAAAIRLRKTCEKQLARQFASLDEIALYNQEKVLNAIKNQSEQARHSVGPTGYGYEDIGSDTL
ncbi:MAG: methionine gamma-lyase family protein [Clostridia bacterium]|nr:methionine gamma-lyase family protein [Clostridia bacterium]